jgi:SOS-response transcriptional repressor LexA
VDSGYCAEKARTWTQPEHEERSMSELSRILKALMHEVSITVTELARRTKVGQPVIHRMATGETDNPKVGSLSPIAKFFNVNISQLIGDAPLPADRIKGTYNPYYRSWKKIPLLNWAQVITWPDHLTHSEVSSFISTEANVSDNAFAIRMEDNTMHPCYPKDTLLIIDPNMTAKDKDFIAVHIRDQSKIQFKQAMFDGPDLYLKPINEDFEIKRIDSDYEIKGVLVQSISEFHQDGRAETQYEDNMSATAMLKKQKTKSPAEDIF